MGLYVPPRVRVGWASATSRTAAVPPAPDPVPDGPAWATTVWDTIGFFKSSQTPPDFTAMQTGIGRTINFNLRFLVGGWASSNRPTSYTNIISAYKNVLDPDNTWFTTYPNVTQIISLNLGVGTQTYAQMLADPNFQSFWFNYGVWLADNGFLDVFEDGRPRTVQRPGWEADSSWFGPWGMRFGGRSIVDSAPGYKQVYNAARAYCEDGMTSVGGDPTKTLWAWNLMAADHGSNSVAALEANVPNCDVITQDPYDDRAGGSYYGSAANPKTQTQKDANYPNVWDNIKNGRTGLEWALQLAIDNGKMYAWDEWGPWFDQPPGTRPTAGGDHAYPAINLFQDRLDWLEEGPLAEGVLAWHVLYNSASSSATSQWFPEQPWGPNTYDAFMAAYAA